MYIKIKPKSIFSVNFLCLHGGLRIQNWYFVTVFRQFSILVLQHQTGLNGIVIYDWKKCGFERLVSGFINKSVNAMFLIGLFQPFCEEKNTRFLRESV